MKININDSYFSILKSFFRVDGEYDSKIISNSFNILFDLIVEGEKGSYYEKFGDDFIPIISKGYDIRLLRQLKFSIDDLFIDFKGTKGKHLDPHIIHVDKRDDSKFDKKTLDIFKQLGTYENFYSLHAPIKVGDEVVGLVCFENFSDQSFSLESKNIVNIFSQQLSNVYLMKRLQEESEQRYENIISALLKTVEVNDYYTKGHAERVKELSVEIAFSMGLGIEEIKLIASGAILHDIGKIGIPTGVLNKKGKLTDDEYALVKEHPLSSKLILDEIKDFDRVSELAYCHHEHYNGKGYPRGLKESDIPLGAQIIQLADAYDAMTSDRAYRKAFSHEKALEIITKESGEQFNPKIVDALLKLID